MLHHISIHHAKPAAEERPSPPCIDSRTRGPNRADGIHTLRDARSGALVGLAVWESAEALDALRPALAAPIVGDDFDAWESEPVQMYLLEEA